MNKVLIDSEVIMDVLLKREPWVKHSSEILSRCDKKEINGYTTAVIISNVHYLSSKTASKYDVGILLNKLLMIMDIIPISKTSILQALNSPFKDFEDAMQNYAATHNGTITTIITRNVKDYKHSLLKVMTPKDYLIKKLNY